MSPVRLKSWYLTAFVLIVALSASLAAACAGAAKARAQPAADPSAANATAAASSLLGAFRHRRIVALGLAHGLRQEDDFVLALLRHPRFAATVDSIVVEFGNARYQALVDRYVSGADVSARALRPVWRDEVGAAPDGEVDEEFAPFFAAVRRLNLTLQPGRRIRIALGDPAFDFRTLHRSHDMDKAVGRRDRVFAAAAEREARAGRHVLLLSGLTHFARLPSELRLGDNAVRILERAARGRVWVVLPYWGGGAQAQDDFERSFISRWRPVAVHTLTGVLGAVPADRILPDWLAPRRGAEQPPSPLSGLQLRAIGDALISFGPCSRLRSTNFSLAQYREPARRAELDRRSRILTGRPFVPPPAKLSDAPYCSIVRP
jgi:hypothetical protein